MFTSDDFGTIADNDDDLSEDIYSIGDFDSEDDIALVDNNGDGVYETAIQGFDTDDDGQIDTWEMATDLDNDGFADQTSFMEGIDSDADGQIDTWAVSRDLDNDGIIDDVSIAQGFDTDNDGQFDTLEIAADVDNDGIVDAVANYEMEDTSVGDGYAWEDSEAYLESEEYSISVDDNIVGNPESDLDNWHQQTYGDTCAIASQEFILDELTGQDFSEDELRQEAIDNGWYTPGGGTPMDCMGNLLEAHGIDVERRDSCTFEDLAEQLDQGQNVMVALDSDEIWNPGGFDTDDLLTDLVGMPGQGANHAVQVIGIDNSDSDNPMVILNDPGHPEGQGITVPAEQFIDAWEDSGQYMVYTTGETYQGDELTVAQADVGESMLGDYYDDDDSVEYNTSWGDYYSDWAASNDYQGYDSSTESSYATEYYDNAAWEAEHSWSSYY